MDCVDKNRRKNIKMVRADGIYLVCIFVCGRDNGSRKEENV